MIGVCYLVWKPTKESAKRESSLQAIPVGSKNWGGCFFLLSWLHLIIHSVCNFFVFTTNFQLSMTLIKVWFFAKKNDQTKKQPTKIRLAQSRFLILGLITVGSMQKKFRLFLVDVELKVLLSVWFTVIFSSNTFLMTSFPCLFFSSQQIFVGITLVSRVI